MPATRRDALWRVADKITHAELFENVGKRCCEIFGGFDGEESPAGRLAQLARKARTPLADLDAVHHDIAPTSGLEHRISRQPARRVHAIAEHNQQRSTRVGLAEQ